MTTHTVDRVQTGVRLERRLLLVLKGLAELRSKMPFADLAEFEKNPELSQISDLFTVELITRYIQGKLNGTAN